MSYVKPVSVLFSLSCALIALPQMLAAQDPHAHHAAKAEFPVPASIRAEHAEIHSELSAATRLTGKTGDAARNLARVLDPHFQREEQIALPPLGLLEPMSRGVFRPAMADVLALTDSLHAEMPKMLAEHAQIRAATAKLAEAARVENNAQALQLATRLKAHALTEEEVTYPAALLVGALIKARGAKK